MPTKTSAHSVNVMSPILHIQISLTKASFWMYLFEDLWVCVCFFGQCYNRIGMWLKPFVMTGRGKAITPLTLIATSLLSLTLILSFFLSLSLSSHPSVTGLHNNRVGNCRTFTPFNYFFQTFFCLILPLSTFGMFSFSPFFPSPILTMVFQAHKWYALKTYYFYVFFCPSPPQLPPSTFKLLHCRSSRQLC